MVCPRSALLLLLLAIPKIAAAEPEFRRLAAPGLSWSAAREPDDFALALVALAEAAPQLATLVELGASVEGRPLLALRLSATDRPTGSWRLLGGTHGDESPSASLALDIAATLLDGYGADEAVTALLDADEVWVFPLLNPDGLAAGDRYNAHGVDLNRNYDMFWSADEKLPGPYPFSEPETRALRALAARAPAGAGLSVHTGANNLGWVWNYTTRPSDDEPLLSALASRYAETADVEGFWTTRGGSWYRTWGDSTDWSYGRQGTLDFTLEISQVKEPDDEALSEIIAAHRPAILEFFAWPVVARGRVIDARTGRGLAAAVAPADGGAGTVTLLDGRFARPLDAAGPVTVFAPGYAPVTLDLEDEGEIALEPELLRVLRPQPALLSQDGDGRFMLPINAAELWLTREGADPVSVTRDDSMWVVPLEALAPGPWDLWVDGLCSPRALLVGEEEQDTRISAVDLAGASLTLRGEGFGVGSAAWALWGEDRAWTALPVLSEEDAQVEIDTSALDEASDPVDLILWSRGAQLAVADLRGDAVFDGEEPAEAGRSGCATADLGPSKGSVWSLLLALTLLRRTRSQIPRQTRS